MDYMLSLFEIDDLYFFTIPMNNHDKHKTRTLIRKHYVDWLEYFFSRFLWQVANLSNRVSWCIASSTANGYNVCRFI